MSVVDRSAEALPLHKQIKADLVRRITTGEWWPGELMPSETALAAEYGVSVGTTRKAIDALVQDNLVVRQRGRGTTVNSTRQRYKPYHFDRFANAKGERAAETTLYRSCEAAKASAAEAAYFGLSRGAPVVKIRRVRVAGKTPVVVEDILLRGDRCPNIASLLLDAKPTSVYALIERTFHILIIRVEDKVRAVAADEDIAATLEIAPGEAILEVDRLAFDPAGDVIEHRILSVRNSIHYTNDFT
ncbi:GntR family transcriptional regulator [Acuticoccus sp. M5D2P5]|uniref:GntR family transcriptional regulator n=1 Tax=Acuticoccus kalidii TaxID=2910977 RepID=UPI001F3BF5A9|nr:GntR family transcriptional regulator [Acuticoccus kalidii]MCF3936150.1 GntR family transcriptional regulator [Acuticoccus kalidii]